MAAPDVPDAADLRAVKARLDQIVAAVNDADLPLEQALALYEEAVKLGEKASEIVEARLVDDSPAAEGPAGGAAAPAGAPSAQADAPAPSADAAGAREEA